MSGDTGFVRGDTGPTSDPTGLLSGDIGASNPGPAGDVPGAASGDASVSDPPTTFVGRARLPTAPTQIPTRGWDLDDDGRPLVLVEQPRPRSLTRLAWIVAGVVALFCLIGGTALIATQALLNRSDAAPARTAPPTQAPKPKPKPPPPPPGLNTPVRDGMFQFTVTDVSCGRQVVSAGLFRRTAQGQFCLVTLTVANIGKQGRGFAEDFQKAIGKDAATYTPDATAGLIVNGGVRTVFSTVHPGDMVSGTLVFDIPRGASIVRLELHDSPFSTGAIVTL